MNTGNPVSEIRSGTNAVQSNLGAWPEPPASGRRAAPGVADRSAGGLWQLVNKAAGTRNVDRLFSLAIDGEEVL